MEVAERIRAAGNELTAAERRVAEVILARPQAVGFGTVADLASASGAGAATVVRLAGKLGFDGYTDLQSSVQRDLLHQLRPAADRIRDEIGDGTMARHLATELGNVQATLDEVDSDAFAELVARLCDLEAGVVVLSGNASDGVARQFTDELALLRPGVARLGRQRGRGSARHQPAAAVDDRGRDRRPALRQLGARHRRRRRANGGCGSRR